MGQESDDSGMGRDGETAIWDFGLRIDERYKVQGDLRH